MTLYRKVQITILTLGLLLGTLSVVIPGCSAVGVLGLVFSAVGVGMHVGSVLDNN
jgi:hypothetical protein